MAGTLERVAVIGLHGNRTIDVRLKDNTMILVGENGSGKTTFLRILFLLLSGRWLPLAQYRFDSLLLGIDGTEYDIPHATLAKAFERFDRRVLAGLPPVARDRVRLLVASGDTEHGEAELVRLCTRYGIPVSAVVRQPDLFAGDSRGPQKEMQELLQRVRQAIQAQVLYLPTYRRIERELSGIFEDLDPDAARFSRSGTRQRDPSDACIELVEFGMKDVQRAVDSALDHLKEFARQTLNDLTLKYLGDVVDREYQQVGMGEISSVPEETIRSVLERIPETVLNSQHKEHLLGVINAARSKSEPDEHSKIVCHYFSKLLDFQAKLKARERHMSAFCDLCSEYICDKRLVYDSTSFSFEIVPKGTGAGDHQVGLSDLSSGEKQIVSLFSHLYLSGVQSCFVLIDEPELSLSVPWQRRFLTDIRKGDHCAGLIAATHSPFIYENDLGQYAHALGEFVRS